MRYEMAQMEVFLPTKGYGILNFANRRKVAFLSENIKKTQKDLLCQRKKEIKVYKTKKNRAQT